MNLLRIRPALALALFVALLSPAVALAQSPDTPETNPATALSAALSAACRADQSQFEKYLTVDSAAAFHTLSAADRAAFMKRFSLSEDSGKALVSASQQNRTIVRCVTPGGTAEFRFGDQRVHDNLAFIRVDVVDSEQTTFGLVHEDGVWRLLSLGLVMLDVPQLAKQWGEADLASREGNIVSQLSSLAGAVETYRRAYGKLPDSLAQMGPAPKGEISPDLADLIDSQMAAGNEDGYLFRYRITSAPNGDSDEANGFELSAAPAEYGKIGRKSFFLDAAGKIHAADKHGEMATASDPVMTASAEPSASSEAPPPQ